MTLQKNVIVLPVLTKTDFMSESFVAKFTCVWTLAIVRPPGAKQSNIFTRVNTSNQRFLHIQLIFHCGSLWVTVKASPKY